MKTLYMAQATAKGGRDGQAISEDGNLKVDLSIPKALGGPGKSGATNPEQLFAAGYAACFESAIRHVARQKKVPITDLSVEAEVHLIPAETGFALKVSLCPRFSGMETDVCAELVETAHRVCPYSNAIKGNIDVAIRIDHV